MVAFSVVEAQPPRTFSFRWTHPAEEVAAEGNSLLVTFDLTPSGGGTLLKMTETGFREMGWEIAVLEEQYNEHVTGWDYYVPRLAPLRRDAGSTAVSTAVAGGRQVDDELWSAIGDPTRRRMLDLLLIDGDGTATTLSRATPGHPPSGRQAPRRARPGRSRAGHAGEPRAALSGGGGRPPARVAFSSS